MGRRKGVATGPNRRAVKIVCAWCGSLGLVTRPDAVYCGPVCSQKMRRHLAAFRHLMLKCLTDPVRQFLLDAAQHMPSVYNSLQQAMKSSGQRFPGKRQLARELAHEPAGYRAGVGAS